VFYEPSQGFEVRGIRAGNEAFGICAPATAYVSFGKAFVEYFAIDMPNLTYLFTKCQNICKNAKLDAANRQK